MDRRHALDWNSAIRVAWLSWLALLLSCSASHPIDRCSNLVCGDHSSCMADSDAVRCVCDPGFEDRGSGCVSPDVNGDGDSDIDSEGSLDGAIQDGSDLNEDADNDSIEPSPES